MKALRIWFAFFFITGIVMISPSCNTDVPEDEEYEIEVNLTVPSNWTLFYFNDPIYILQAISPKRNTNDKVGEDLWIARQPLGGNSLDLFYLQNKAYYSTQDGYEFIYENTDTTINGNPCRKLVHKETATLTTSTGDISLNIVAMKYFLDHSDTGYIINCNSLDTTYYYYKPQYDTIVSSFSFK